MLGHLRGEGLASALPLAAAAVTAVLWLLVHPGPAGAVVLLSLNVVTVAVRAWRCT